uniref:BAAT/Acyl-CoA thioester hydrolase C-terminal domain-containing protein n=1 Tax=Plectus sambesii TaxID=2011161 RepID=A0A914WIY5_9BILA
MRHDFTGKQPAVIDIFGTGGGLMEHRAALLSSKGFAVLSLAYFDYKDLPKNMDELELNYFEEAIDWLSSLPNTSDRLGFIGTSLGASIAVLAGIHYPKLRAVVPINGFHMLDSFNPMKVNGIPFHTASGDLQHLDMKDGILRYSSFLASIPTSEETIFRIETCPKDTYWHFLTSGDDQACCSEKSARILENRLIDAGKGDQVQVSILKHTGHLLEPPYMPHCEKSWHKHVGSYMVWGGDKYNQAKGQEDMWNKLIAFFSDKLGSPPALPPFSGAFKKSYL